MHREQRGHPKSRTAKRSLCPRSGPQPPSLCDLPSRRSTVEVSQGMHIQERPHAQNWAGLLLWSHGQQPQGTAGVRVLVPQSSWDQGHINKSYFPQIQMYQKEVKYMAWPTEGIASSSQGMFLTPIRHSCLPSDALPVKGNVPFPHPQQGQARPGTAQSCTSFAGTCKVPAQLQPQALKFQRGQTRLSLNVPACAQSDFMLTHLAVHHLPSK